MTVTIPIARLKIPADAWQVLGDRAVTITGCWSKRDWNMIHAKLTRKKDGKTWEQDFKMDDGKWTSQGDSKSANEAINPQEHTDGETNAKIIHTNVTVKNQTFQKGLFRDTNCKVEKNKITPAECLCKANIHYPVIEGLTNKLAQEKINQAFKSLAERNKCEGVLTNVVERENQNSINQNYEITFQSDAILAIANNIEEYGNGAAHGLESIEGFIIDIKTGNLLIASDVFGKNIPQVNQIIYSNLRLTTSNALFGNPTKPASNRYILVLCWVMS
jgi:hypothetical protein